MPSGLISVMPQAWITSTPYFSWNFCVMARGAGRAADHHCACRCGSLRAGRFQVLQQRQPDRRHAGGEGHLVVVEQFIDRGAVELRARA